MVVTRGMYSLVSVTSRFQDVLAEGVSTECARYRSLAQSLSYNDDFSDDEDEYDAIYIVSSPPPPTMTPLLPFTAPSFSIITKKIS